jgi:hypothetical protein
MNSGRIIATFEEGEVSAEAVGRAMTQAHGRAA